MRWKPGAGGNVEDRRGRPGGRAALPVGGGLVGVIVTVLILVLGGGGGYDVGKPFDPFPAQTQPASNADKMETAPDAQSELLDFLGFVVGDLQKFWAEDFRKADREFAPTKLIVFTRETDTGCGTGSAATGPFYCPRDRRIYIDLGFFRELANRFRAPGDFAQAYVLAHEYGHHVQNLPGSPSRSTAPRRRTPERATRFRFGSSCRPTASPACGRTPPSSAGCSRRATSRRG